MPILALCEKGLILDVFGSKPQILGCEEYKLSNDKLVFVLKSKIKFINLQQPEKITEIEIPGFSEFILSPDGSKTAVMCYNKVLKIFKDSNIINSFSSVENFGISDNFYCFSTKTELKIFNFESLTPIFETTLSIKTIHCLNSEILFITEKTDRQKIFMFKNEKMHLLIEHPEIFRTVVQSYGDSLLLLADIEYTGKSYYADSILYLIKFNELSKLKEIYMSSNPHADAKDQKLLTLNNLFGLISFPSLKKIHSFGFHQEAIYICFGDQPAYVHFYNSLGLYKSKLPSATRNTVVFNRSGKRVINAGFGNLPGNIEVFENGVSVCYFESLGASYASWLNDDSRFMIATTNYFKSDNKICVYDYYGKLLEIMECKSLVSARVYGKPEPELQINRPEEILKQKKVVGYVPPHLRSSSFNISKLQLPEKPKLKKKAKEQPESKIEVRTIESINKELEECYTLKERLKSGEELSLEDENKVFKIKVLEEELSKLSNK